MGNRRLWIVSVVALLWIAYAMTPARWRPERWPDRVTGRYQASPHLLAEVIIAAAAKDDAEQLARYFVPELQPAARSLFVEARALGRSRDRIRQEILRRFGDEAARRFEAETGPPMTCWGLLDPGCAPGAAPPPLQDVSVIDEGEGLARLMAPGSREGIEVRLINGMWCVIPAWGRDELTAGGVRAVSAAELAASLANLRRAYDDVEAAISGRSMTEEDFRDQFDLHLTLAALRHLAK
jgi:hypothetical protein